VIQKDIHGKPHRARFTGRKGAGEASCFLDFPETGDLVYRCNNGAVDDESILPDFSSRFINSGMLRAPLLQR
jgi:hypothetical protein